MRVLVVGAQGQVGRALTRTAPSAMEVFAFARAELDITEPTQVDRVVRDIKPELIVNAAAYTAVDRAESERERAAVVNEKGVYHLAIATARSSARIIHISTDYVFAGDRPVPAQPGDATGPLSVYGATKLAGERAIQSVVPERSVILRTSWVYAAEGHNFVQTMLRLMRERGVVRVVADQIGAPTAAFSVARAIWAFAERARVSGTFHWTDAGVASWYDFAVAIAEEGVTAGLLPDEVFVAPITTADFPTAARRPPFSLLNCSASVEATGLQQVHWRVNLRRVLEEMKIA